MLVYKSVGFGPFFKVCHFAIPYFNIIKVCTFMHGYHKQLKVKLGVLYIHLLIWMCKHAGLLQGLLHYTHKDVNVSKLGTLAITWGNRLCLLLFPMLHSNLAQSTVLTLTVMLAKSYIILKAESFKARNCCGCQTVRLDCIRLLFIDPANR